MRKILLMMLVLTAFIVAACAQTAPTSTGGLPPAPGQIQESKTSGEAMVEKTCEFDEEAVTAKAIQGKDLAAYPPFVQGVSVGDCATFGIVLGNYHNNLPQSVYVELKYLRAYDASSNNPGADDKYMPGWIKTNFPASYALDANKFVVFPVNVVVGDKISDTKSTSPATYEFELVTYTYQGSFQKEYQPPLRLTVKTK